MNGISPWRWVPGTYMLERTIGRVMQTPPTDVEFGEAYGRPFRMRTRGRAIVWMFRKGQRVRFFNNKGEQVGPEQRNVVPAVCYAQDQRWEML